MFLRSFVSVTLAGLLLAATAQAQQLLPEQSRIEFTSKQMGVPVKGQFTRFDGDIDFKPAAPEQARIRLSIDTGSATLGIKETDAELPKAEWFDVGQFPQATFTSSAVKATGEGQYEVTGTLAIKGQTQAVTVPVTLKQDGSKGVAEGEFAIKRLGFGIGAGDWADTSMVADAVQVRFSLALDGF